VNSEQPAPAANPDLAGHMPALDGLRAAAVMLVVLHHIYLLTPLQHPVDLAVVSFARSAWMGVDLFFVLSGFLITGILLDARESERYFRAFYWRRLLRIFPLYYGFLLVVFVIAPALGRPLFPVSGVDTLWFWLHVSNFYVADGWIARGLNHFWTLAIEEQFYLVWPALVYWLPRRIFFGITVALLLCVPLLRLGLSQAGSTNLELYVFTFTRIDTLAFGALVALLARQRGGLLAWRGWAWGVGGLCAAALIGVARISRGLRSWAFSPLENAWVYSAIGLMFAALIVLVLTSPNGRGLNRIFCLPMLRNIGVVSYAIYVFQVPVDVVLRRYGIHPSFWHAPGELHLASFFGYFVFVFGLTWAIASLSWHAYEKQFLKLKPRIPYR
jgi:peptidoglycan/LPS O-acetylase OafA/YrhL